jgi:hypothetical protein
MTLHGYVEGHLRQLMTASDGRMFGLWRRAGPGAVGEESFVEVSPDGLIPVMDPVSQGTTEIVPHALGFLLRDNDGWKLSWFL